MLQFARSREVLAQTPAYATGKVFTKATVVDQPRSPFPHPFVHVKPRPRIPPHLFYCAAKCREGNACRCHCHGQHFVCRAQGASLFITIHRSTANVMVSVVSVCFYVFVRRAFTFMF